MTPQIVSLLRQFTRHAASTQRCRLQSFSTEVTQARLLNNAGILQTPLATIEDNEYTPNTIPGSFLPYSIPAPLEQPPVYVTLLDFLNGSSTAENDVVALDPSVFDHPLRKDILFLCVNFYRDALRQGSANTKTRGEVAGSGHKIRPQKGTGKARLGDGQSPMLRGGGVAFGPRPRDFSTKLPRKVRQMGLRVALSAKVRQNELGITRTLEWPGIKTNKFSKHMKSLGWGKTLFVTGGEVPLRLERVCRNVENTAVMAAEDLHVYTMLKWPRIVLDVAAVEYFERLLSKTIPLEERIPMPSPPSLRNSRAEAGRVGKRSPPIPEAEERGKSAVLFE